MEINDIKDYLKDNLHVIVETESSESECTFFKHTYVNLYLENELISSSEIEELFNT